MYWGKGTTNNSIGWGKGADNNSIGWGSVYPVSSSGDTDIQSGLANTVAPAISGTNEVGETLTCTTGTWSGGNPITYAYQWKRDGVSIGAATNSTYVLISADAETDITCTVTATNSEGSNSATSNTITIAAEYSYLVDDYSPNAAYSLRKVSSTATNAIRVRRSSDNAEQNIGFDGVDLDTTSLLSFVGANDGFVVKIYEQGGIGSALAPGVPYLDATMSISSTQPKIVNSGTLITLNGKPSMLFDGADDRINFGVYDGLTDSNWDIYSTIRVNTGEQFVLYVQSDNNAPQGGFNIVGENGAATAPFLNFSSLYKNGSLWSPTTRDQVHDELATSQAVLLTGIQRAYTGWGYNGYENPTWNFVGYWSESIFFENNNSSSIRTDIESNINTYYGIY